MEPGIKSSATPSDAEMAPAQKSSLRGTFQRSPIRDEIIALLSTAPPDGTPIAAI
jgi:hypothetical protein